MNRSMAATESNSADTTCFSATKRSEPINFAFVQTNGVLRVFAPTNSENPDHLIYNPSGVSYDPAVQEVLARIRMTQYTFTDGGNEDQLSGVALCCQSNASASP